MSKTTTPLLARLVAHNAAVHRDGLHHWARLAAGERTIPELLAALADSIAMRSTRSRIPAVHKVAFTIDERIFLIQLLAAIADGRDVRAELRIDRSKVKHRKANPLMRDLTIMVDSLIGSGLGKMAAYRQTGRGAGMEWDAVRKQYEKGKLWEKDVHRRMRAAEKAHAKVEKR